ncbi:hypothetical protein [Halorussus halobius]|uniref:hypothetical protein n=1 Tax=Halorussus halobius TaxID=1710537 RepID=UPI001091ECFA|nr:hypothetical protein [Halorussus halobius]
MDRRRFLLGTTGLLTALAGCSGGDSTQDDTTDAAANSDTTTAASDPAPTTTAGEGSGADTTTVQSGSATTTSEAAYTVRVEFDGEWQGSITTDGSSRSVQGSGTESFTVTGDPFIVSANAQKQSDGDGELTVQIREDGEVISEQSTTAAHGVAQVTSESGSSISDGSTSSESTTSGSEDTFEFKIVYDGEWSGSISAGGSARTIEGSGTETISIDGSPDIISGNAQKQDESGAELTVQVLQNGDVVKEASTSAEYGVAQVSYSSF